MSERILTPLPSLDEILANPERAQGLPPAARQALTLQALQVLAALATVPVGDKGPPEAPAEDRLLTPEEAAARLGLPVSRIRELCRIGRLPAFKEGKGWLLPSAALRKWVSEHLDKPGISMIPSGHGTSDGTPSPPPARPHPVEIRRRPRGERPDS